MTGHLQPAAQSPMVTLLPGGASWSGLLDLRYAQSRSDRLAAEFRTDLGLPPPTQGPVVMSGHQAQWWHAGILSKTIAMTSFCRAAGAHPAWVVVDQDAAASLTLNYPALRAGAPLPERREWTIGPSASAAHLRADVAIGDLPPFLPNVPPEDAATPDIQRGLRAIANSAARWQGAASAAEQIARANDELVSSLTGQSPSLILATRLSSTRAMRMLLDRMVEDPRGCVESYNQAVRTSGQNVHGLAQLSCVPEKGRYELPLWQLSPRNASGVVERPTPRKRVFAGTLSDTPLVCLAPRALLMTGLLRWLGCDLFIHGTGGGASDEPGGYDKVAQAWFQAWLGVTIAPSVVASATVRLPMGIEPTATHADLRQAQRTAHAARHDPSLMGEGSAHQHKARLVAEIATSSDPAERRRLYRQMHDFLGNLRSQNTRFLDEAALHVADLRRQLNQQAVLLDRTWPWPLLPRQRLLELDREICQAGGWEACARSGLAGKAEGNA